MFSNITTYDTTYDAAYAHVLNTINKVADEMLYNYKEVTLKADMSVSHFLELYNADSLDQIEILMALEEEFEVEVSDETAEKWLKQNVSDIVAYFVEAHGYVKLSPPSPPLKQDTKMNTVAPELGILLLPSLEDHGRVIKIENISQSEATALINDFTSRVVLNRKTKVYKDYPSKVDGIQYYHNIINFDTLHDFYVKDDRYLSTDLKALFESKIPTYRGNRAVFISATVIGVGTTVVYNKNWATINFDDTTIVSYLQNINIKYSSDDEEEEPYSDSDSYCS